MITRQEYEIALAIVHQYKDQLTIEFARTNTDISNLPRFAGVTKDTLILNTTLSTRAINCIFATNNTLNWKTNNMLTVSCLEGISKRQLLKVRNIGKSSLIEIVELCRYAGVTLVE